MKRGVTHRVKYYLRYMKEAIFLHREEEETLFQYLDGVPWITSFVFLTRFDVHKRTRSPKCILLLTKLEYIATREVRFDEVVSGNL